MKPQTEAGRALLDFIGTIPADVSEAIDWRDFDADVAAIEEQARAEATRTALEGVAERVRGLPSRYPRDDDGSPLGLGGLAEEYFRAAVLALLDAER